MTDEAQPLDDPSGAIPEPVETRPASPPIAQRLDGTDCRSFAFAGAIAFTGYLCTLAPDVTLEWSGLMATSANYAAPSAPPGYPVWTLYSWLCAHLIPFSNIAWRVAVGSAVASAVACGLASLMVSYSSRILFDGLPAFSALGPREQNVLRLVCGCVAGLVLAFSGSVWENAVIVESRGLSLLFFTAVLCLTMRWFFEPVRKRYLCWAFLLFGLLLATNQEMIVAFPALVVAVMLGDKRIGRDAGVFILPLAAVATCFDGFGVWSVFPRTLNGLVLVEFLVVFLMGVILVATTRRVGTEWKATLAYGFCLLLGLAFYFYLPLASMTNPPVNWGYPRTGEGFVHLVTRGQWSRVRPTSNLIDYCKQLVILAEITGKQFGWFCSLFILPLLIFVRRISWPGRRWLLALTAACFCTAFVLLALLNPPPDRQAVELIEDHFAPTFVILAICFGLGLIMLGAKMARLNEKLPS